MSRGVFVSMEFNLPTRDQAVSHAISDAPICEQCSQNDPPIFNINCQYCQHILKEPATTVSQIFAIMRQWAPQTQRSMGLLVTEALRRGANVNDRDSLTDMTMLHYCAKAGAKKIGNLEGTIGAIRVLLENAADVETRCPYVDMTPVHFAALFNAPDVILVLVREGNADPHATSKENDGGNALHIAARALALDAIRILLRMDCDPHLRDDKGHKPVECMPQKYGHIECDQARILEVVAKIHDEFEAFESEPVSRARSRRRTEDTETPKEAPGRGRRLIRRESSSFATLETLGLSIGDRVVINRNRMGTLRFFGHTEFQEGVWAGVELDEPTGKNDGSVGNYRYFSCRQKYGTFCPPSKLIPLRSSDSPSPLQISSSMGTVNRNGSSMSDVEHQAIFRATSVTSSTTSTSAMSPHLEIGANVTIAGGKKGTIMFIDEVKFKSGIWVGVELNDPIGKHDGTVEGTRYFKCKPNHGIFVSANKVFRDDPPQGMLRFHRISTLESSIQRPRAWSNARGAPLTSNTPKSPDVTLSEGMTVFYLIQKETGIVRYIGPAELGEGIWIGVEFSKPIGKSEGKVNLRDYFKCKPNYGILVRPSKLSYRGINCLKLVPSS